ncbi:cytochrome c [Psychrobacter frigidicola]|uniref:Cytochrome c n=1 Tax=Psychrobacter frigidicola TaxID=45611 RepID=A0A5C7A2Y3_9GAMM|nr:cytochrome c [Psychrobacter frigidicola]TXD96992.1 cytochrome c [Psychrobacter frigidicola]
MTQSNSNKSFKSIFGITIMAAVLGLAACTPTHPDVKARQDIMKNYGDAAKIMGGMVKEPDTFDADVFKEQAAFLATESKNPWSHFEDTEAVGNAKPEVWSNNANFLAESENFQKVTAELNTVAQTATTVEDIKPAFGAVGKSCKSCHDDFQVKKDD